MANFNKVILAGRITRDIQLKYTPNNTPIAEFGLAINRTWKREDGHKMEEVCFVDCTAFGKTGELINQYVAKGDPLLVEGRLKLDQWESKEGWKRSKLSVVVESMQFLGSKNSQGQGGNPAPQGNAPEVDENGIPF